MAEKKSGEEFGLLLTEGIRNIQAGENKLIRVIQDELGYALEKEGGASIEYWRKGHLPSKVTDIEILAREIFSRAHLGADWLRDFVSVSGHPDPDTILSELLPGYSTALSTSVPNPITPSSLLLPVEPVPSPAPLPPGSRMPLSRNPLFVGRIKDLENLAQAFNQTRSAAISQIETTATTGLGGIGKTQLASEFVHRYGQYFPGGVFWLRFADPESIPAEIAACGDAGALNIGKDFHLRSLSEQVRLVQAAWQAPVARLLIFDNCEEPELLVKWRPTTGGCRVLVTTRRGDWESFLGVVNLPLGVLDRNESEELLANLCPSISSEFQDLIAAALGDLPLALHLAGSYLQRYQRSVSPENYLQELRKTKLLEHRSLRHGGLSPTEHVQNVGRTFALSYEKLNPGTERDKLAQRLLVHAAHFAPGEPIWYELLIKTLDLDPDDSEILLLVEDAFSRLIELGLIQTEGDEILRIHRLIAAFVALVAEEQLNETKEAVERVVQEETAAVNALGYPLPLLAYQYHLRSVIDLDDVRITARSAALCDELGQHLWQLGDYKSARPYYEKALAIHQQLYGEMHAKTAHSLNRLGYLHHSFSRNKEARQKFQRALNIHEQLCGFDSIEVAKSLNYLGQIDYAEGEYEAAKEKFKRSLEISQSIPDAEGLMAEYLNNMGRCMIELDEPEKAKTFLEAALAINRVRDGEIHAHTGMNIHGLALVNISLNQLDEALEKAEQAVSIREQAIGPGHGQTAHSLTVLADVQRHLGQLSEARENIARAFQIYGRRFGQKPSPSVAAAKVVLGQIFEANGNLSEALDSYGSALDIQAAVLPPNHPHLIRSRQHLKRVQEMLQVDTI